jgi:hypothetical protein
LTAKRAARLNELVGAGLPKGRAGALAALKGGPYNVVLYGAKRDCDEQAICQALHELGYQRPGNAQV